MSLSKKNLIKNDLQGAVKGLKWELEGKDIYAFAAYVNQLFKECFEQKDFESLFTTIEFLTNLDLNQSESVYFHFDDAFNFLFTTCNVNKTGEVFLKFMVRKNIPCEKTLLKLLRKIMEENSLDLLEKIIENLILLDKVYLAASKEVFGFLQISNQEGIASRIILNVPFDNPSILYIWEGYVENFVKCFESARSNIKQLAGKILPQNKLIFEQIYDNFLQQLIKNKMPNKYITHLIDDILSFSLTVKQTTLREFLLNTLDEEMDFELIMEQIIKMNGFLDAYTLGSVLKKLIQRHRKIETFKLVDYLVHSQSTAKFTDINLSQNEFKYIIMLQNQINKLKDKTLEENGDLLSEADILEKSDFSILENLSFDSKDFINN